MRPLIRRGKRRPETQNADAPKMDPQDRPTGLLWSSPTKFLPSLWHLLKGRRTAALAQTLTAFGEGLSEAATLVLIASLGLDFVENSGNPVVEVGPIGLGHSSASVWLVGLVLVRLLFALFSARLMTRAEVNISRNVRLSLLSSYVNSDSEARRELPRGTDQQALSVWPQQLGALCGSLLAAGSNMVIMAVMLMVAVITAPVASFLMALAVCLGIFLFLPIRRRIRRLSTEVLEAQSGLAKSLHEAGDLVAEAEIFGVKEHLRLRVTTFIDAEAHRRDKVTFSKAIISPLYTALVFLLVAVALVILFASRADNVARFGPVLLLIIRSVSYGQNIQRIGSIIASLRPLIERLRQVEGQLLNRRLLWGSEPLQRIESIRLHNVSYSYPESGRGVASISLSIGRGARIGLVGPSGGGKSTIVRLLLGELEPQAGQLLVNGVARELFMEQDFRRLVVGVPQFPHVVNFSLRENVKFFRSCVSDHDVTEALKMADLDQARDPETGPSSLDLGGSSMSGGQTQRVGLARALAGDPELLILDEPTSAIDQASQSRITESLLKLPKETTVVLISHRPEVLQLCSTLYFIKDGEISSVGSPDDVLKKIVEDEESDSGVAFG